MSTPTYAQIAGNGLWKNNPALVQLLGLCPLLAVATLFVLVISNLCVSLIRNVVTDSIRLPAFVLIIAAAVTGTELLMQAYAYELYQILGIFLPLITTNCVILGRADAFAAKNRVLPAAADGVMMGLGFGLVLVVLGAIRELLGTGALFANMDLLLGPAAQSWTLVIAQDYPGLLLAILPPGAFIITGLLIAGKNVIDARVERANTRTVHIETGSKRVRVTGEIA
jgi:electron transport complex protein RnfE